MKKALFAGTFDPLTLGHLDLIQRAARLFEKFYVAVAVNSEKHAFFSIQERLEMLKAVLGNIPNVEVISFEGLAVDCARDNKIDCLIRGFRSGADLEFELGMASMNRQMTGIETFFLSANGRHAHISSSLIKEIATFGKRLHEFVPPQIERQIYEKFQSLT